MDFIMTILVVVGAMVTTVALASFFGIFEELWERRRDD